MRRDERPADIEFIETNDLLTWTSQILISKRLSDVGFAETKELLAWQNSQRPKTCDMGFAKTKDLWT